MSNEPNEVSETQDSLPVAMFDLYVPKTDLFVKEMTKELQYSFVNVNVDVIRCPDLRLINLTAPGLTGRSAIMDVGSLQYLFPRPQLNKKYCFRKLLSQLNRAHHPNFIIGAGKHSNPPVYDHADLYSNIYIASLGSLPNVEMKAWNKSCSLWWSREKNAVDYVNVRDTTCSIHGNFFLSEGYPGPVIRIMASERCGPFDYLTSIHETLTCLQKNIYQNIGLGGVFISWDSDMMHHNIPSTTISDLNSLEEIQDWLTYDISANYMTAVGTIMSGKLTHHDLIIEGKQYLINISKYHFHSLSENKMKGGHIYNYDNNENQMHVNYVGYFNFAQKFYSVDSELKSSIHPIIDSFEQIY